MVEKLKEFMGKGGYSILIFVVAFAVYVAGVNIASSCANEANLPVEIKINSEGQLYVEYIYEDYKEIHVLWETDGGNIMPLSENDRFNDQYTDENKGYFCYTNVADKVVWNQADADGNNYKTANVRALVYEEIKGQSIYNMQDYFIELYITVTVDKNGKVVKAEDRYFSNPIRENGDKDWNQIYPIFEGKDGMVTYRYRTGNDIDGSKELYARWQCNEGILNQTDIVSGYVPNFKISDTINNLKILTQINTITVDTSSLDSGKNYEIEAFLVEKEYYDHDIVPGEKQINKAIMNFGE